MSFAALLSRPGRRDRRTRRSRRHEDVEHGVPMVLCAQEPSPSACHPRGFAKRNLWPASRLLYVKCGEQIGPLLIVVYILP
jgi:hypothetical protein